MTDFRTSGSSGSRYGSQPVGTETGPAELGAELRVWIDQDLCTGDGICTDHAPSVFTILEDGIAYCVDVGGEVLNDPGGAAQLAAVPATIEQAVIDAAAECPGECIFLEFAMAPELEAGVSGASSAAK